MSLPLPTNWKFKSVRNPRFALKPPNVKPAHKFKCDDGHEPIEHEAWDCPICELKAKLADNDDLQEQIDDLEAERDNLKDEVEELRSQLDT